jgi:hypothetical protein
VKHLLRLDGFVNLLLGLLLLLALPFPGISDALGVPPLQDGFYGTVLGALLLGIGLALLLEAARGPKGMIGLGLGGAIAINLSGALALLAWSLSGALEMPLRGQILLWTLTFLLIGISAIELLAAHGRDNGGDAG